MNLAGLRIRAAAASAGRALNAGVTVSLTPLQQGAGEGTYIGSVEVGGTSNPYVITQTRDASGRVKVVGNVISAGATATTGTDPFAIGGQVIFANGVALPWTGEVQIENPLGIAFIVPGDVPYGSWAAGSWPASSTGVQGSADQYGYDLTAKGAWLNPVNMTVRGVQYFGVQAYQQLRLEDYAANDPSAGIASVRFSIDGGETLTVTETRPHPETGKVGFLIGVRSTDWASGRRCELRAEIVPLVGEPYILEGFPNPMTGASTPGGYRRLNTSLDMWSLPLSVDPLSNLPNAIVWKAPTASSAGNDSNSGLTRAAPLKTWRAVVNKIKAIHGNDDLGGAEIRLTNDPGFDHDFGLDDWTGTAGAPQASDILKANAQWLKVLGDPDVPRGTVKITSATPYGLCCEKLWIENVLASATISNRGSLPPSNAVGLLYFDLCFHRFDFDGGPAVDAAGLPYGPVMTMLPNGYNYWIDSTGTRTRLTNFYEIVHLERSTLSHIGQYGDVMWNPKVIDGLKVSYVKDLPDDGPGGIDTGQHVDAAQFVNQRRMMVHRDFDATEAIECQIYFSDRPSQVQRLALIRPRFNNASTGYYAYGAGGSSGLKDHFIYDPEFRGTNILGAETPRGLSIDDGPAPNSWGVQYVLLAGAAKPSGQASVINNPLEGRYGQTYLAPWITAQPAEPQPAVTAAHTAWTDAGALGVFDVRLAGRMDLTWSEADGAYQVQQWKNNGIFGWTGKIIEIDGVLAGFSYTESTTTFRKSPNALAPLLKQDALWGMVLEFNGVNTGPVSGTALSSGNAGWPLQYRPSGANAEFDAFLVLDQQEVASVSGTKTIWAVGGTASSGLNSMDLKLVTNGSKKYLILRCATAAAGSTLGTVSKSINTLTALPAAPSLEGRMRIRVEKRATAIKMTIWHAAYPSGVTLTTDFDPGFVATINGGRMNLGGTTVNSGGTNGQWPKMRLGAKYLGNALYTDPAVEAEVLADFAEFALA